MRASRTPPPGRRGAPANTVTFYDAGDGLTDAIDFEKLYDGAPRMPWDNRGPQPLA
ncbi:hypothetical protein ACIA8K_33825 [Catenuloplanes sp. NPDC051500]|uniref:hypothetical protein n=1 Tax=Catenuloplanes sp. NPDC051500 TaxID=3363959 RepID=UPI003796D654